jgi:adenylate kinase family enzyme
MRYTILLNPNQQLINRLAKQEQLLLISIRDGFRNHKEELPAIQKKMNQGQLLDNTDIHQIIDLEATKINSNTKDIIFTDYPKTLAQAQDLIHYLKLKGWSLNSCIYFKYSSAQLKSMKERWRQLHTEEEMIQDWLKKLEKEKRNYKEILALFPFNQSQELISDQPPLQLYQKVIRICKWA